MVHDPSLRTGGMKKVLARQLLDQICFCEVLHAYRATIFGEGCIGSKSASASLLAGLLTLYYRSDGIAHFWRSNLARRVAD
jgi:hypothetical protein